MAKKKTFHSAQGDKIKILSNDDKLLIAQPDSSALEGYRTVNIDVEQAIDGLIRGMLEDNTNRLIYTDNKGIIGTGTVEDPIRVDMDYVSKRWALGQLASISQVGNLSQKTLPLIAGNGFKLRVGAPIDVYLGGVNYTIPVQEFNIANDVPSPANKKIHIAIHTLRNKLRLYFSTISQAERYDCTYIGTITTNASGIASIQAEPFMRIGTARLAATNTGGGIPITAGDAHEAVYTGWGGAGSFQVVQAGIDTSQYSGSVQFNTTSQQVTINQSGRFFIQDLERVIEYLGSYTHVRTDASTGGHRRVHRINGLTYWMGNGANTGAIDFTPYLRNGWNTVSLEAGSVLVFSGPFLRK